nr:retrovirus-related Pol polyprotein from transposon TNT 1-94 [Tanacetum cinerariifolium]
MASLADKAILSGADNRSPMLEKDMYDSWKSRMELYMLNRQHGRMILESVEHGPLLWPTVEEVGVTRLKKYSELSAAEAIQADCDVKATNIILQALPPEIYALDYPDGEVSQIVIHKEFTSSASFWESTLREDTQHLSMGDFENGYSRNRQKPGEKRQNQTQNGKDQKRQSKSKPEDKSQTFGQQKSTLEVKVNRGNVKVNPDKNRSRKVVLIVLWYLDSGCSKHMIEDRSQLINFVQKFLGTVKFGNDHVAKIMGYSDYQIGNVTISRVYYVEGLGHNLFSVGQFCNSELEVAFRQHTCFIRNLDGVDMLTGSRGNNLYTLSLQDMMASSPICLLSKASKTKSWLWHRHLSHLNFGAINHLARQGLVRGLLKLKFEKDHLCLACAMGKSTKKTHKPKSKDTNQEKLYLLHMDLYGPMHNGTKFVNQTLRNYYGEVGISHETSVACSPQQNGVVERCNRTLIEAARTMLIYAQA